MIANRNWRALTFALTVLLGACNTAPPPTWTRPGASQRDVIQALSECEREADRAMNNFKPGIEDKRAAVRQEIVDSCMRGRTFHK